MIRQAVIKLKFVAFFNPFLLKIEVTVMIMASLSVSVFSFFSLHFFTFRFKFLKHKTHLAIVLINLSSPSKICTLKCTWSWIQFPPLFQYITTQLLNLRPTWFLHGFVLISLLSFLLNKCIQTYTPISSIRIIQSICSQNLIGRSNIAIFMMCFALHATFT